MGLEGTVLNERSQRKANYHMISHLYVVIWNDKNKPKWKKKKPNSQIQTADWCFLEAERESGVGEMGTVIIRYKLPATK